MSELQFGKFTASYYYDQAHTMHMTPNAGMYDFSELFFVNDCLTKMNKFCPEFMYFWYGTILVGQEIYLTSTAAG